MSIRHEIDCISLITSIRIKLQQIFYPIRFAQLIQDKWHRNGKNKQPLWQRMHEILSMFTVDIGTGDRTNITLYSICISRFICSTRSRIILIAMLNKRLVFNETVALRTVDCQLHENSLILISLILQQIQLTQITKRTERKKRIDWSTI